MVESEVEGQAISDDVGVDMMIGEGFLGEKIERIKFGGIVAIDLVGTNEMGCTDRVGDKSQGHGSLTR
eukprot:3274881-Ditylum_brightwellii.AAC.1